MIPKKTLIHADHSSRPPVPGTIYEFQAAIREKIADIMPQKGDPLELEVAAAVTQAELCAVWETYPHLTVAETIIVCERHYIRPDKSSIPRIGLVPPEHRRYAEQAKRLSLYAEWASTNLMYYDEPWQLNVIPIHSVIAPEDLGLPKHATMLHLANFGPHAVAVIDDQTLIWLDRKSRQELMEILNGIAKEFLAQSTPATPDSRPN